MIAENKKGFQETDKLFRKLVAPSLGALHLDSRINQHHAPFRISPVPLPHRPNSCGPQEASKTSHRFGSTTHSAATPPATEVTLEDSFTRTDGQRISSRVNHEGGFTYNLAARPNTRRQVRLETSLSEVSCPASIPWTFCSTTKMKQLPLPQVQSSALLRTSCLSARGTRNVSMCSDRYLGPSRVGLAPQRRSKSAAAIVQPTSGNVKSSEQMKRFEEERLALLQTRNLRKTTEVMTHRKDRKYHMCGSGMRLHNRYEVDSEETERLRQLIGERSAERRSTPVSHYGRYGVGVASGLGTEKTQPASSSSAGQQSGESQEENTEDGKRETGDAQKTMPDDSASSSCERNATDVFITECRTSEANGDGTDVSGQSRSEQLTTSVIDGANGDATQDDTVGGEPESTSGETKPHLSTEEALLSMLIHEDKIAAMEGRMAEIDVLKGEIRNVGHMEESTQSLDDLNADGLDDSMDYRQEVFGRVLNDAEQKEVERLREGKRQAKAARARKADDSIVAGTRVAKAKSKMAELYNFISPHQQEVFERKFQELDIDGNGIITLQELHTRMYRGRENRETGRAFMQVFDLNKDQTIDEREFVIVAALNDKLTGKHTKSAEEPLALDLEKLAESITAYKEIFQVIDHDSDGRLTLEDVMLAILLSGDSQSGMDPEIVQHVLGAIDADDNGTIDFAEFLTYVPFFLKLYQRMVASHWISIGEVEAAREAVRKAVLKVRGDTNGAMSLL